MAGAQLEIVLAMAWGDVDEAGALFGGDEVAGEQWHGEIVAVGLSGQRMARDAAGQSATVELGQGAVGEDAGGVGDVCQALGRDDQPLARPRPAAVRAPRRPRSGGRAMSAP